jgi:cysteine desulfurase
MRSVYFDYNATTPLAAEVREAMLPFLGEIFGNPSSLHHVGRHARSLLDEARERVAQVWTCKPSEVVFTSGGTESNNLAIFGAARLLKAKGRHLITSAVEHHAVLHCFDYLQKREGFEVTVVPADSGGRVTLESIAAAARGDTVLVSIMSANNEIGSLEPVQDIGAFCRERGIIFHTDAVQSFGKEPFISIHQFHADLVSVCAHKFHGPKGAGALFVRSPLQPDPILFGGGHENERRAGTENIAAIAGFAEATERFVRDPVFPRSKLLELTQKLEGHLEGLSSLGVTLRSPTNDRLTNTVAFTVQGCDSISLLAGLDLEGVCASSGSACSAGSLEPSHVLVAIGVEKSSANALVRFSLGKDSTESEVEHVVKVLPEVIQRAQQFQ